LSGTSLIVEISHQLASLRTTGRMKASKLKFAIFAYFTGTVVIYAIIFWNMRALVREGYPDFAIYYRAGIMVRRGLGRRLYDDTTQVEIQREFSPEHVSRFGALPYNHPAFEAVLFVPFTYVSYPLAFVLWDVTNLVMVGTLPFLLRPHLRELQNYTWPLWVLTSLAFFPIFAALLQGQDAILLLFLYALALLSLKKDRDAFAGSWLAIGLFKPHLILPFVLLLLLQGRKKILYGFVPMAVALTLISTAIAGGEVLKLYPAYVAHLEQTLAGGAIVPSDMPNLRGALALLLPGARHLVTLVLAISLGLLLYASLECRRVGNDLFDLKFSLAAIATVLVSYHVMMYDLSLLMLPVLLLVNQLLIENKFRGYRRMLTIITMGAFFFAPLQLLVSLRNHRSALLGWVLLLWLFVIAGEISFRTSSREQAIETPV
jgi:hypothetical protein